jgi:hypothetical protein
MANVELKKLFSCDFGGLGRVEQYFALASAYLEGSRRLTILMLRPTDTSGYADTRVILHLCRQALELFLKGTIYGITGVRYSPTRKEGGPHNLHALHAKYESVLLGPHFHFDLPFGFEILGKSDDRDDKRMTPGTYHATLDQRHRFPDDIQGNLFTADFDRDCFMPDLYLQTLQHLAQVFSRVENHLRSLGKFT